MQTVILCEDILDQESWKKHEVEDIREFLISQWEQAPAGLAIYHEEVSEDRDVTPVDEAGIERLGTLTGTFWVVLYPGEPKSLLAVAIWQAVVGTALSLAVNLLITPTTTNSTARTTNVESQNNALSERTNTARPNGRIPDIFGQVRSTPDLISKPYTIWEHNREVEHSDMCIGRGAYVISDMREDDTLVTAVEGMCVSVYGPFTSANSGHPPQVQVGASIGEPVLTVRRSAGVNGQVIKPPESDGTINWSSAFVVEDAIQVIANFVCQNGCYGDNGTIQIGYAVGVYLEITPVDANDNPVGPSFEHHEVVWGSDTSRDICGTTFHANVPAPGRYKVRARRENRIEGFDGVIVDECKWRDLYAVREVSEPHFGNVTTVKVKKYATPSALALTESKFNCLVTRMIPVRQPGGSFSAPAPTINAADIFVEVSLDERIGRRSPQELDLDSIYDSVRQVSEYFGDPALTAFSYTFDSSSLSYEETASTVAKAAFCVAYRQGSQIRLKPEIATEDSVLLFNHRNTVPGSQTRSTTFGNVGEVDGVELEWVDPEDDSIATLYIPPDRSSANTQKIETMGIRNRVQAWTHAIRAWNKAQHKHVEIEQEVTAEALLLTTADRILVADLTRPGSMDGQVEAQTGLALTLSQPADLSGASDWQIFLQHVDGTVEAIPVSPGPNSRTVLLGRAPRAALSVDPLNFAQATYQIARGSDRTPKAFLLTEASQSTRLTRTIKAINYDHRYYLEDGLQVWMNGGHEERSGYARLLTPMAGAEVVNDSVRGQVHHGLPTAPSYVEVADLVGWSYSYGFSAWVSKDSLGGEAEGLFGSKTSLARGVMFASSSAFVHMLHGSALFCVAVWPGDGWHHITCNYDVSTGRAWLTLDGSRAAEATGVAAPAIDALIIGGFGPLRTFTGKLDDVRYRPRPYSDAEAYALYRATKLPR